jgi:alkylation response protein AidB-like acyl-CoA dehydrogenase
MSAAERGMGIAQQDVRALAGSDALDRLGMREQAERLVYRSTRDGFRAAGAAARTFAPATRVGRPARLRTSRGDLFDLTPSDEQAMIQEACRDFAERRLRPAAGDADAAAAPPPELLEQAAELGLTTMGVPDELGGAVTERSAVTAVLAAEALAHGDMGLAVATIAPAGVASALTLWGDADQQSTYLPALVEEAPPVAAIALAEPRALFDPFELETTARRDGDDWVLSGVKSLVPRGADAELLVVAARAEGRGPALFVVEPVQAAGVLARPAPAMGLRAAATAELLLEDVRVPGTALLAGGDPGAYAECVRRARLAWCALAAGTARAVLDYVIPYVNERTAFGEPISNRQAVAFAVADIAIELEGLRLIVLRAAARADAGDDFAREVALARSLCAERAMRIGSDGVGLLGGHGYVKEHPVERWYRDLRAAGVMEGGLLV